MKYAQVVLTLGSNGDTDYLAHFLAGYLKELLPEGFGLLGVEENATGLDYDGPYLRMFQVEVKEGQPA